MKRSGKRDNSNSHNERRISLRMTKGMWIRPSRIYLSRAAGRRHASAKEAY